MIALYKIKLVGTWMRWREDSGKEISKRLLSQSGKEDLMSLMREEKPE